MCMHQHLQLLFITLSKYINVGPVQLLRLPNIVTITHVPFPLIIYYVINDINNSDLGRQWCGKKTTAWPDTEISSMVLLITKENKGLFSNYDLVLPL